MKNYYLAIKNDNSVLLKHECCYCLGQIGDPYANQVIFFFKKKYISIIF